MAKIVIIGGGIAGLSAAHDICQSGRHDVVVLEGSGRLGGKIGTVHESGLIVERGPDSVFTTKPWATQLMAEIGLEDEFVEPMGGGFSMLVGGRLHPVPRALASLVPSASSALEKVGFFSKAVRERILSEKDVPQGNGGDETIASFFRRRFGTRFSKTLAEPLLAGIHAGDPERLSMRALYPSYLGLEQKHGSLTSDRPAAPMAPGGTKKATFVTLRRGMQSFVDRLAEHLTPATVRTGAIVEGLVPRGERLQVVASDGTVYDADGVVLAVPASVAKGLVCGFAPEAARLLSEVRFASTAVVTLAFPRGSFKKEFSDNGFLIPFDEPVDITGVTLSSNKWPGRAPDDHLLLRAFIGSDGGLDTGRLSDDEVVSRATGAIERVMRPGQPPTYCRLDRWDDAMPQYGLGHLDRQDEVERLLSTFPLVLAGSSFRGSGIPDCVRQGREAASTLMSEYL